MTHAYEQDGEDPGFAHDVQAGAAENIPTSTHVGPH
jgi:hypothetical protein